jgi:ribonucleotide monophosphatase NagD (HAD superfamily)
MNIRESLKEWVVSPRKVMMVGDNVNDDISRGKHVGAITCLLDESGKYNSTDTHINPQPDFKVNSLFELSKLKALAMVQKTQQLSDQVIDGAD